MTAHQIYQEKGIVDELSLCLNLNIGALEHVEEILCT